MSRSRSGTPDSSRSRGSSAPSRGSRSPSPQRKLEPKGKNVLNLQNLQRLDLHNMLVGHLEEEPDLDYPCKDKSKNVNDFSEWSYFKRPLFHEPPLNAKHSFTWSPKLLERIAKQNEYMQYEPEPKLAGYKETRANLDRKKRAKRMLAIWKKKPIPSYAGASDGGALTGRTDTVTVGLSTMSLKGGAGGRAGRGGGSSASVSGSAAGSAGGQRGAGGASPIRGRTMARSGSPPKQPALSSSSASSARR